MGSVSFSTAGLKDLELADKQEFQGNVTIMYHNGPLVAAEDLPSNVTVLASFRKQGEPWGKQDDLTVTGKPAVTTTVYGKGRVVSNGWYPRLRQQKLHESRKRL